MFVFYAVLVSHRTASLPLLHWTGLAALVFIFESGFPCQPVLSLRNALPLASSHFRFSASDGSRLSQHPRSSAAFSQAPETTMAKHMSAEEARLVRLWYDEDEHALSLHPTFTALAALALARISKP